LIVAAFASEKCEDLKHTGLMFTHMFASLHVVQWTASFMRIVGTVVEVLTNMIMLNGKANLATSRY
jgi:hypothetical protein